jgi:hypothetical protein
MTEDMDKLVAAVKQRRHGYFTIWTGWMPLAVFRASGMREARSIASSEDLLREFRCNTVIGKPLLEYGGKVWVGLASSDEQAAYDDAESTTLIDGVEIVWLQKVDQ